MQQHVQDPNQEDNKDAEFLADKANRVKEQTQARITSTDQNDAQPTPGTSTSSGPPDEPGNSEANRVAQSEDREGAPDRAPQEREKQEQQARAPEARGENQQRMAALSGVARRQDGSAQGSARSDRASQQAGQTGQRAQQASREQEAMPDALSSDQGSFTLPGPRQAALEQKGRRAKKRLPPPKLRSGNPGDMLGLGSPGTTPGGVNLNLTPGTAVRVIGEDRLARERLADGQRRLSAHRGSWKTGGMERWRSAIENYVPSVKPGNQTALNTARSPTRHELPERDPHAAASDLRRLVLARPAAELASDESGEPRHLPGNRA